MAKLTEKAIKNPKLPAKGYKILWDDDVKGFGIRITANGAVSFIFNYRTRAGRMRRLTIGSTPTYSVEAARRIAKKHQHVVDDGGDPLAAWAAEGDAPKVSDLCDFYIEHHLPKKRPAPAKTDRYTIEHEILPALKHLTVAEVKYSDINRLHRTISKRAPYRANRVLALLSTMFGLAIKEGWRGDNPTKGIERNVESPRERYLNGAELDRLLGVLATHPDQSEANAVRLLMLTGARRGEVLGMKWDQINFEEGKWTKPSAHTKQKKPHHVPLSAPALAILSNLRKTAKADAEYVFPGDGKTGQRTDLKKPWAAICKAAKIKGLRLHDLRHNYASIMVSGGASLPMIGKLLGHTQAATTLRYAHLQMDPLREATERVGAVITGAGKSGAEVVKLRERN